MGQQEMGGPAPRQNPGNVAPDSILRLEDAEAVARELSISLLSGGLDPSIGIEKVVNLTASLGAAAIHLKRSLSILEELGATAGVTELSVIDGEVEDSSSTASPTLVDTAPATLGAATEAQSVDPEPVAILTAPPLKVVVETKTPDSQVSEPSKEQRSSDPALIEINPLRNQEATDMAKRRFGDKTRSLILKPGGIINFEGVDRSLAGERNQRTLGWKAALLTLLFNNRGRSVTAKEITELLQIPSASTNVKKLEMDLFGSGNAGLPGSGGFIEVRPITTKRFEYSIADDVVVIDEQAAETVRLPAEIPVPKVVNPEADHEIAPASDSPPPITLEADGVSIGDQKIKLSKLQVFIFEKVRDLKRPIGARELVQAIRGRGNVGIREINGTAEALFNLKSKGLLKLTRIGPDDAEYEIELDPLGAWDSREHINLLTGPVHLDADEMRVLKILSRYDQPLTIPEIAERYFNSRNISRPQHEYVKRLVKGSLYDWRAIRKNRPNGELGGGDEFIRFSLAPEVQYYLKPETDPRSKVASSNGSDNNSAVEASPKVVLPVVELIDDKLVQEGRVIHELTHHERMLLRWLNTQFGTPLLEDEFIADVYPDKSRESREAYRVSFGPLLTLLQKEGYLKRDVRKGGVVYLSLLKPFSSLVVN